VLEVSHSSAIVLFIVFIFYLGYEYNSHVLATHKSLKLGLAMAGSVASASTSASTTDAFSKIDLPELRARSLELSRKEPKLPILTNLGILVFALILTIVTSIFVIQSIEAPFVTLGVSKSFVGLVMIPVVYGCAEQTITAIRSQTTNIDWIIEVAIDSCIRVTLFILPITVMVGWATGVEAMSLFFDGFQVTMLGLVVVLVNYIMHTGSSHWYDS
jgi:Ca2+:H+ antiporter